MRKNKQSDAIKDYEERQPIVIKKLENKIKGKQTEEIIRFEKK